MSVLIHSVKGQSRACTVACSYVMRKYRWALLKSLEFLNSRMTEFEIRPSFIHQLTAYENRLIARGLGPKTFDWTEVYDKQTNDFENEELLLRNTYINAQMGQFADLSTVNNNKTQRVKWTDEVFEHGVIAKDIEIKKKSAVIYLTRIKKPELKPQMSLPELPQYSLAKTDIKKHTKSSSTKEGQVTQIINQNIVNNFIINNPQKVEVVECSPVRAQHIPKLSTTGLMHFNKSNPGIKKRPTSAPKQMSSNSPRRITKAKLPEKQSQERGKMRLGSKVEPPKGESSDQPQEPISKHRPATPGSAANKPKTSRNITILSVRKPGSKLISSRENMLTSSASREPIPKPSKKKSK